MCPHLLFIQPDFSVLCLAHHLFKYKGTNNLEAISNKNQTRTSKSDSKWLSSGGWRRRASVARTVRAPPALRRAAVNLRVVHALVLGQLAVELDERVTLRPLRD